MTEELVLFQQEDGIATITINRPKQMNALNPEVLNQLEQALDRAEKDKDAKVILITGAGEKAFVAGADIAEMSKMTPLEAKEFSKLGLSLIHI